MEKLTYYKFLVVTLAGDLHTLRVLSERLLEQVRCLKKLVTTAFRSLELMGIGGILTYRFS